jgi:uncharacterized protein YigE (DUF2233 family)
MKLRSLIPILVLALLSTVCNALAVDFSVVKIAGKPVTICRVNVQKEHLQLFLNDEKGAPFNRFSALAPWLKARGQKLVFAMNAGMYHRDFQPVGLFVSDGKQLAPLNLANGAGNFFLKPNGVFLITDSGAQVIDSTEYPLLRERVVLATQSGPLLVQHGKIHPAFKPDSKSRLYRNGVGVPSPGVAIFAISEAPLNLDEFALLFRDVLHCPDALFLDGTVSSLYAPALKRNDFHIDLGPIIGITE